MGYQQFIGPRDTLQLKTVVEAEVEERVSPRFTLLIRTAKLICESAEYLCVIRDVSTTGISVRMFHSMPSEAEDVELVMEMQTGDRHRVKLIWQRPGEAGFRFVTPVDVEQIIRRASRFPKRELRFAAELPVRLVGSGGTYDAVLRNFSQQGAMIETGGRLAIAQTIRMESPGWPNIEAKVRWRKDERYGLIFDTTFRLHDLAAIVHALRTRPSQSDSLSNASEESARNRLQRSDPIFAN